jgi:hypothetical protein
MNQGPRCVRLMGKRGGRKSRATVPLREDEKQLPRIKTISTSAGGGGTSTCRIDCGLKGIVQRKLTGVKNKLKR